MIKKTAVFLAVCAALAINAGAQGVAAPGAEPGNKYVSDGSYFRCFLPQGWRQAGSMGSAAAEKKVYGVDVVGPAGADGIAPSISVKYYARGNTLFKSAEEFVRIHSKPVAGLGLAGDKYGLVTGMKLAGRTATTFERRKSDFARPRQVENKAIPVFERYIVLPAKGGFYVLNYYSVFSEAKAGFPAFEGVIRSFEPMVK